MKHFLKLFAVFSMLLLTHLAQAQPQISADPTSLDLGDQTVPQISNPQNVTITNVGDEDLQIQGTQVIGQNSLVFLIQEDLCAFQTISPGDTCIIGVAFKPNLSGIQTAQLVELLFPGDVPNVNLPRGSRRVKDRNMLAKHKIGNRNVSRLESGPF